MIFTSSWDDGYALDLTVAALLKENGLTGTFYVCPAPQHGRAMLMEGQIRTLSETFEIGAHTLSHSRLSALMFGEAQREIEGSKAWVEQITGKPCAMFCYPKGDFGVGAKTLVKQAGFRGARTTEQWRSWYEWFEKVIWYGNKKGAYLYGTCSSNAGELAGHY